MAKLFRILGAVLRLFHLQNMIVIEAENRCENTGAVIREIIRRGWTKRYTITLVSSAPETIADWKSRKVRVQRRPKNNEISINRIRYYWIKLRAVMIIDEAIQMIKLDPHTIRVFLCHGSPAKSVRNYYHCKPDTDYMLNLAEFWKPINAYEFAVDAAKLVTLGYPRNDDLVNAAVDVKRLFQNAYQRIVVWYPTYRQHSTFHHQALYHGSLTIPVVHDKAAAVKINAAAAAYNTLLVIKPHPVQDMSLIRDLKLDHIKLIDDAFFAAHSIRSYQFLAGTDALITDYSSVVFDYLLTGKPIALTFEDYDLYKEQVGFAIDMNLLRNCSVMLNTPEDFEAFFRSLKEGSDPLREKREELKRLTNQYTDGSSAKRVVDWLETLLPGK